MADTPPNTKDRHQGRIARFVSSYPVVVVSWLGAAAYVVTRDAQTSFYSKFGLEPEDVGLGYAQTLSRAAPLFVLVVLFVLLGRLAAVSRRRAPGPVVAAIVLGALLVLALWMPWAYTRDAHRVKERKPLRPAGLSTPGRLATNPLGLRAEPVRVVWIDKGHAAHDFGSGEVMYLGRAEGNAVFFDPEHRQTVHVPESDIVIERAD